MANSIPYVVAILIVVAVVLGLTAILRKVSRNRSSGEALLAAMLLFASWVPPPPRAETEMARPRRKTGGDSDLEPWQPAGLPPSD